MKTKEEYAPMIALYREWNERINVVSRKDIDALYEHHILHSLAIAEYVNRFYPGGFDGASVLDVGTGGGFPGIPLATEFPQAQFTLCDSIGKKVKVAQAVADAVGLKNVTTLHARAEEVKLKEHIHKDKADLIISRAVTSLANFIPWVKGRYTEGILYLKGGNLEEEIAEAIKKCRMRPSQIFQKDISDWFSEEYFQEKKVLLIK